MRYQQLTPAAQRDLIVQRILTVEEQYEANRLTEIAAQRNAGIDSRQRKQMVADAQRAMKAAESSQMALIAELDQFNA